MPRKFCGPRGDSVQTLLPCSVHNSPTPRSQALAGTSESSETLCVSFWLRYIENLRHSIVNGPAALLGISCFFHTLVRVFTLLSSVLVFYMFQENRPFYFLKVLNFICIELNKITLYNFFEKYLFLRR